MERNKLFRPTMFLAFDYDREEAYLNHMAQKGWKLIKGGLFHHSYVKSDQVYRYKLDFNNKVKYNTDEYYRYLSIFNEQGWEHVNSTINGWHYFSKAYDPQLPEEEYMLYTDNSSLSEMLSRWNRIARIFQILFTVMLLLNLFTYMETARTMSLFQCITCFIGITLFQLGIYTMNSKGIHSKSGSYFARIMGLVLIVGLFISLILTYYSGFHGLYIKEVKMVKEINQYTKDDSSPLTITDTGEYYLDIRCKSERGIVMVQILQDNGVIFNAGGAEFNVSNSMLHLKAGEYTVKVIYYLEDYKENFNVSQSELEKYHLTGDLSEMSKVDIFIGIKR